MHVDDITHRDHDLTEPMCWLPSRSRQAKDRFPAVPGHERTPLMPAFMTVAAPTDMPLFSK
jgi:hypothetical protein